MADYDVGADYVGDEAVDALMAAVSGDDDDDVGADYEEVGARRARRSRAKRALSRIALAGKLPVVFLGFDTTAAASAGAAATTEPNVKVRPTDLIVRDTNADDFQITSMRIGRVDLLTGATGIPAGIFKTSVQRPPISAPELEAGTQASIQLTNLTAAASRFMASYLCLDLSRRPVSP
ncbi:MAG TPA: hypothetical protein VFX49_11805 [Chloroflexota bacterium]|nr:hypothetical protein [Chloroflexota bacterium]